jgi:protein TonB
MRGTFELRALVFGFAITVTSCASPPTADIDGARAALDKASADRAGQYAASSFKAAEEARANLDAELKVQDEKWFKSYDRTRELAAAAKAAGEKASADAVAGKQKADVAAAREKSEAARAKAVASAVKVGGQIKPPTKIKDVRPVYPAIARSARVAGTVVIQATIGADGKVIDTKVVKSVPMLDQAALDAVQQWEYTPSLLNGAPVPVTVTVTIDFKPS